MAARGEKPMAVDNWERMNRLATRWLPPAHVIHPYPEVRFDARTQGRSLVR